jgi:hypothetical protein
MARSSLPTSFTRLVMPRSARGYAEALGWKRVAGVNGRIAVYSDPEAPLRQLIVPLDEGLDDYAERMTDAIERLAEFERRPASEILNHLLLPPADLIRLRESSADAEDGNLPLDHAVRFLDGTRTALLATAHSVLVPQPYHPRLSRGEAEQFLSRCRMGRTDPASFALMIACPLDLESTRLQGGQAPFARRVTSLFMRSLHELVQAADPGKPDDLEDSTRHPGFSANLCESLLMLRPNGNRAYVAISAAWSRAIAPPKLDAPSEIRMDQEVFEIAEALAARLRSKPQPRVDRFLGFVDVLRGQPIGDDSRPSGEVRFTLFDKENEIHARASLTAADYAEAAAAHLANEPVTFKGVLHRLPRLNRIDEVTEFRRVQFHEGGNIASESTSPTSE